MKRIFIAGLFALGVAALLFVGGCGKTEKRKVVEVKTVAPPPAPEVQAVVYKQGKLRMEITLLPSTGADGSELANMSVAFIRL